MVKTVRLACALAAAVFLVVAGPVLAQRQQFPSPMPQAGAAPGIPPAGTTSTVPGAEMAPPSLGGPPSALGAPYQTMPPAAAGPAVPVTPGTAVGPAGTYQGSVELPPAYWDPYGVPGGQPPVLLPQDPYVPGASFASVATVRRFLHELRLGYIYMAPRGSDKFSTNDLDLSATFSFPFLYNQDTPLLVTPGFTFHWWEGPVLAPTPDNLLLAFAPARMYDAYLGTSWNPQLTPYLGSELEFRIGVYSDFDKVTERSLRYTGKGLAVLSLSPRVKIKAGVMYLDRIRVKILPAGGIVWIPNADTRLDILFPNPRMACRLTTFGNTDWWLYARGEYGGGSWAATPDGLSGAAIDEIEYSDLRFALGLEFDRHSSIQGNVEIGVAFERKLLLRSSGVEYSPSTTVFLGAGLVY